MILQSAEEGVLEEMIIIAAGMSIQDPRERPGEAAAEAIWLPSLSSSDL